MEANGSDSPDHTTLGTSGWTRILPKVVPGCCGVLLYLVNNLDVWHGLIAPPPGYAPMGVQRNADIAIYLTWLYGYGKSWFLPNYSAPWITPADFIAPGLVPVALLQRLLGVSPATALQLYSLLAYVFAAYAIAFAYRTFCSTRREVGWAILVACACVPLDSLPFLPRFLGAYAQYGTLSGYAHFITLSDGFFRALVTWPFLTFGTGFQALSMGLLVRYVRSSEPRWLKWLVLTCFLSALMHPFEIFVTVGTVAVVFGRKFGITSQSLKRFAWICVVAGIGVSPYVVQTLSSSWMHEVANANVQMLFPSVLVVEIGAPLLVVVVLMLFGLPGSRTDETLILKTWFVVTFLLFFTPGLPFALHLLDGSFIAIGLLLVAQVQELLARRPRMVRPMLAYVGIPLLAISMLPHILFRAQAWDAGVATDNTQFPYDTCTTLRSTCLRPTAIAPAAEVATRQWLRKNASPDDLVLATEDASSWLAQAPMHSFGSHWLFSLLWQYPNYRAARAAFFSGGLSVNQGHELLRIIGARFVVVPDGSPAAQYLDKAVQRARLDTWTIYEVPGARMKPYHDPEVLALGGAAR